MFKNLLFAITTILISINYSIAKETKRIHVYNWSDYIAEDTIIEFEKKTGIKVSYDVFDSNELLEGKILAGSTGYNILFPSSSFLARQIESGIFQKLDKTKLSNYKNLDPELMYKVQQHDPLNRYAIPYLWATTGIGFNTEKVKQILGKNVPLDSWDLVFNINNLKKLSSCGVSFLDSPEEMFATALHYLKKNPNSTNAIDYKEATDNLFLKIRPYIRYFHSSHYINDLASGNTCVAVGWAGDMLQTKSIAKKNKNDISYVIPKEGALAFFDMIAIPSDATNIEETYKFINYLLEPSVIAKISNKTFYANVNKEATPLVDEELRNHPGIYPNKCVMPKLFLLKLQNMSLNRIRTGLWNKIKLG